MKVKFKFTSRLLVWILCSFFAKWSQAQETQIQGHFLSDSLSIGSSVQYSLTARYPSQQQVLFPDSSYSFHPFEWKKRDVFPTRSTGNSSFDSVVYYLTTFELDTVLKVQLPVYIVNAKDCVSIKTQVDSVTLNFIVTDIQDSISVENLPLKTDTDYKDVRFSLDYPFYSLIGFGILVTILSVWMIFGKQVKKFFVFQGLKRRHNRFVIRFNSMLEIVEKDYNRRNVENVLLVWKVYMERLDKLPYTKSTSKEIYNWVNNENINKALKSIDRCIYGGEVSYNEPFQYLVQFSNERLKKKEQEVRYG